MSEKSYLISVITLVALPVFADTDVNVSQLSPYTTEQLVEQTQEAGNYITGDGSAKGGMTQAGQFVELAGQNYWYAQNVTLDLGAVDRVFCIPELHTRGGGSITVASGTLRCGSWMWWLESGGGTMTFTGPNSCFNLAADLNYGTGDLSDFYLEESSSYCSFKRSVSFISHQHN